MPPKGRAPLPGRLIEKKFGLPQNKWASLPDPLRWRIDKETFTVVDSAAV
jgi:hypothetical protein